MSFDKIILQRESRYEYIKCNFSDGKNIGINHSRIDGLC